ncbi:ESSS subunit of NADH:ubiquinone oxidoreductase, partial [Dimargaris cristalligena]
EYNRPSGWLFGEKPLKPGQKRVWEAWEYPWYYMYYGGMALAGIALYYKPDTSVQAWATVEAKRRLKERGEYFDW